MRRQAQKLPVSGSPVLGAHQAKPKSCGSGEGSQATLPIAGLSFGTAMGFRG